MMEVERMTLNVVIPVLNEEKALRAGVEGDGPVPGWDGGRGRVHHHDRGQRIISPCAVFARPDGGTR